MTTLIVAQNATALQNLIPAFIGEINGQQQPLVDARKLHEFLEIGRNVNTWLTTKIEEYQFVENVDYVRFPKSESGENKGLASFFGGHNRIDYHLTLDMAKELSMVERNDKGRLARRYFIECEKQLMTNAVPVAVHDEQISNLKKLVLEQNPTWYRIKLMYDIGLTNAEISRAIERSYSYVERQLRQMRDAELISNERCTLRIAPSSVATQIVMEI